MLNSPILQSIIIPEKCINIDDGAFAYCDNLTNIQLPTNSITTFPNSLFYGCSALEEIIVPEGVTQIGEQVFSECNSLKKIVFPSTLTKINGYNTTSSNLEIHIPSLTQWLNIDFARDDSGEINGSNPLSHSSNFYVNGEQLPNILTIPDDVYDLKLDVLGLVLNQMTGIIVPYSVESIRHGIYSDNLKWLKIERETPPTLDSYNFDFYSTTLLVPCNCIRAYRDADKWKEFYNIWDIPYYYELSVNKDFIVDNYYNLGGVYVNQKPTCDNGNTLIIEASPIEGYHFEKWSDGDKTNPRTIQLTNHLYLTAEFAKGETAIEDIQVDATTPTKLLLDGQIYILRNNHFFDATGKLVK